MTKETKKKKRKGNPQNHHQPSLSFTLLELIEKDGSKHKNISKLDGDRAKGSLGRSEKEKKKNPLQTACDFKS